MSVYTSDDHTYYGMLAQGVALGRPEPADPDRKAKTMTDYSAYDDGEIREKFGFVKTKQLVYKERAPQAGMKTSLVASMKLVHLDQDEKMGSLEITLEDGRAVRICSGYLKEMQLARFSFETRVEED